MESHLELRYVPKTTRKPKVAYRQNYLRKPLKSPRNYELFVYIPCTNRGPCSSDGISTDYGLDGPGSNPGGGEIFRTCPDQPWDPPSLL